MNVISSLSKEANPYKIGDLRLFFTINNTINKSFQRNKTLKKTFFWYAYKKVQYFSVCIECAILNLISLDIRETSSKAMENII